MSSFNSDVKADHHVEAGWPQTAYGVSKIGVTLMTPILQKQVEGDESRPDIVINSVSVLNSAMYININFGALHN